MSNAKSIQALQEFLILGKSAPGAAAVANIQKCISSPNTYVFAELLELPHVQALANDEDEAKRGWVEVVRLFAWGDYMEWKEKQSSLPSLTEPQLTKLKQLSLITIASQQPENLTYASLQRLLDIPTIRALEDLVISAIYASLLSGKLDTASSRVEVSSTAGRDLAPNDVENMITLLTAWTGQCESVLREINEQVDIITKDGIMQRKVWARYEQEVRQRRESKEVKAMASGGGGGGGGGGGRGKRLIEGEEQMWGGGGDDEMDLDDGPFGDDGPGGGGKKKKMGASLASIGVANFALGRRKRRD